MKKHKHDLDSHHNCLWVNDVQCLIICGSELGLARNNKEQHLWMKRDDFQMGVFLPRSVS